MDTDLYFYLIKPKWKIIYFNVSFSVIINILFLDSELEIIKVSKITKNELVDFFSSWLSKNIFLKFLSS